MAKACTCTYLLPDLNCKTGQALVRAMTEALEAHRVYVERRAPIVLLNNLEYDGLEAAAEGAIAAYRQHCFTDNWRQEIEVAKERRFTFVLTDGDETGSSGIILIEEDGFVVANESKEPHEVKIEGIEALLEKLKISKNHWK